MAFDTTKRQANWVYLVQVLLSGVTKYYSNLPVTIDGQFYNPAIKGSVSISTQLSDVLNPQQTASSITLEFRNEDQALTSLFNSYTWANRIVRIYLGEQGTSLSSGFSQVFEGRVRFPNGIQWDEKTAWVIVNDRRVMDSKALPVESPMGGSTPRYVTAEYSLLETKSNTNPKQILVGDWGTVQTERIRAICVNTTTRKFRIAGHAVSAISKVYKQAGVSAFTSVTFSSVSLSEASFILGVAYDSSRDVITVHAKGAKTAAGTLIENPSKVLKYLLQTHMGVPTSGINTTAFSTLETGTPGIKLRRHLTDVMQSSVLIEEIAREVGLNFYIKNGQYFSSVLEYSTGSGLTTFTGTDLVPGSFRVIQDPDNSYFNSLSVGYAFNPETGQYRYIDQKNTTSIADVQANVHRSMEFNWIYREDDADNRASSMLYIFSKEPTTVLARFKARAMLHYLTDQLVFDYENPLAGKIYSDAVDYQIRSMDLDPSGVSIGLSLWDISLLTAYGHWANDSIPAWASATPTQRDENGFWTDDDGNIVPGDPNTALSLWATETAA